MKCERRFEKSQPMLNLVSVEFLQDIAEKAMSQVTIHIDLDKLYTTDSEDTTENNEEITPTDFGDFLNDLSTIIKTSPGTTQLAFNIRDSSLSTQPLQLVSKLPGIRINRNLVDFIRSHEGMSISI